MSVKLDLDISQQSTLELRYQDTGSMDLQITDNTSVIQSLAGCIFTLDVYEKDYEIAETVTAALDISETTASFSFNSGFWDAIDIRANYSFRIRRQVATEIKTIINGDVIIK